MGKPLSYNIELYQGDRYELFFRMRSQIFNPTTGAWEPGPYIDLTGNVPAAQIRATRDSETIVTSFQCSLSDQSALPGGVLAILLPSQTALLTAQSYVYDLQLKKGTDYVTTYLQGSITATREVTRGV